jgi:hypothetical protein
MRIVGADSKSKGDKPIQHKLWRELVRPFRRLVNSLPNAASVLQSGLAEFDPQSCTVEPEGLALLSQLVAESAQFPGPIVEIGTLIGITATHMALAKQPWQKIITVDNYCWNPWGLPPDAQYALAQQVLFYLIETGQVEQVRPYLRRDEARY